MASSSPLTNGTDYHELRWGWVESGNDRGTLDILWSSSVTIVLCCWVATHPNVGAPNEGFIHRCIDKTHLAIVGLLGPDLLLGLALGQLSSARRSVKKFKEDKVPCNGAEWTITHAFFTDMGGIYLTSPDYPDGFPINSEQLHWLVKHFHVDFPDMEQMNIKERNTSDMLSRLLVLWQALWFSVIEIQRIRVGLPMTTLELTALSYVFVMFFTQIYWFRKPAIQKPRMISTKDNRLVEDIRTWAREHTHPDLPLEWYRTPLTFLDGPRFHIEMHWCYYTRITHILRLPVISRPMTSRPWNRVPSDTWLPIEKSWVVAPFCGVILLVFSFWSLLGWNFFYPTPAEQYLWRACAIIQAVGGIYGGTHYAIVAFRWYAAYEKAQQAARVRRATILAGREDAHQRRRAAGGGGGGGAEVPTKVATWSAEETASSSDVESQTIQLQPMTTNPATEVGTLMQQRLESPPSMTTTNHQRGKRLVPRYLMVRLDRLVRMWRKLNRSFDCLRNISADNDPEMALPLRALAAVTIVCVPYTLCRVYLYVEDYISLRVQPVGVYVTVNRYVPFWGSG